MEMIEVAKMMLQSEYGVIYQWLFYILALMGVDQLTGFIQAVINKTLKSSKMSTGLLKKGGILSVLIIIVPLTILLPEYISISIIVGVYIVETINELISIAENLKKMGVNINFLEPIFKLLNDYNGKEDKK